MSTSVISDLLKNGNFERFRQSPSLLKHKSFIYDNSISGESSLLYFALEGLHKNPNLNNITDFQYIFTTVRYFENANVKKYPYISYYFTFLRTSIWSKQQAFTILKILLELCVDPNIESSLDKCIETGKYVDTLLTLLLIAGSNLSLLSYDLNENKYPMFFKYLFDNNMELPPVLSYPVKTKYSDKFIRQQRDLVKMSLEQKGYSVNLEDIDNEILQDMFELYDKYFFLGRINRLLLVKKGTLTLDVSGRMTKTAGVCKRDGCSYSITISRPIILNTFVDVAESLNRHKSNGLFCYDRLECLMNIFEHELIHLVINLVHGTVEKDPIYKSHGLFFKDLAFAYFGHTEFKHSLHLKDEYNGKKEDFKVLDDVSFKTRDGVVIRGMIKKMNPKTAVVKGYKVPYKFLTKIPIETIVDNAVLVFDGGISKGLTSKKLGVGDIVAVVIDGKTFYRMIEKVNETTYDLGSLNVPHDKVRLARYDEIDKDRFKVGDVVVVEWADKKYVRKIIKINDKHYDLGDMKVKHYIPRAALPGEIPDVKKFTVGQKVIAEWKGVKYLRTIKKVNPKTYDLGDMRISHQLVRLPTTEELETA